MSACEIFLCLCCALYTESLRLIDLRFKGPYKISKRYRFSETLFSIQQACFLTAEDGQISVKINLLQNKSYGKHLETSSYSKKSQTTRWPTRWLDMSGAVRETAGYSVDSWLGFARSDTLLLLNTDWKHQPLSVAENERYSFRMFPGWVEAIRHLTRNLAHAHLSHSQQRSSASPWTVCPSKFLFLFMLPLKSLVFEVSVTVHLYLN
jgi:hypothetical protein